ncbi:F-box domain-containing protein [Mycena indigotica]|uniref:F-box domain-containing protein n=1 Tax=Mycena indigotica TaxID=2126181 RepID=A0A8H6RZ03_9AGAR|nr:F-box domain-containing protein [Mycena indigotica]KAF7289924.1 F-box domain-containing protein [Mycena indigotica]
MPLFPPQTMARHRSSLLRKKARVDSSSSACSMGGTVATRPLPREITSRLAPELYDHFLNALNDSKTTLFTCSLVCKAFLHHSRRYLFASVNLRPDLVKFLSEQAMETIVPFIRSVGLGGGWMREQQHEFNGIISFMTNLDNIRNIHIEAWSWDYLAPPAANALLSGQGKLFQTVTVLDLKFIHFPSLAILCNFASQFSALRGLFLDNVTWDKSQNGESKLDLAPPSFLSRLEKLTIRACACKMVLSWLLTVVTQDESRLSLLSIRFLSLPEVLVNEVALVNQLLSTIGPALEHLELGFLAHSQEDAAVISAQVASIDLSIHTHLRNLSIHQLTLYQFPRTPSSRTADPSPCVWLVPLLQRISSPVLSHLNFGIWLGEETQLDLIDWHALVRVLKKPMLNTSLRAMQFNIRGVEEEMDDQVQRWIKNRLRDWGHVDQFQRLHVSFE